MLIGSIVTAVSLDGTIAGAVNLDGTIAGAVNLDGTIAGARGFPGRGIVSILKTSTVGLVDTYTITYTDDTTSTFTVTNAGGGTLTVTITDNYSDTDFADILTAVSQGQKIIAYKGNECYEYVSNNGTNAFFTRSAVGGQQIISRATLMGADGRFVLSNMTVASSSEVSTAVSNHNSSGTAHSTLFSGKADSVHTHGKSDITDFAHTHTKSEVTDFAHTHTKSEVTDFAHTHTKSEVTDFAHTHTKSEVTDFAHNHDDRYYTEAEADTLLSGKANASHSHTKSEITDFPTNVSAFTNDSGYLTTHQDISGKADRATTLSGYGITDAKIASETITLGSNTIAPIPDATINALV